ncbi:hypothetical protein [Nostoc punctiforme]|uniref:Uncharacterized protein n=2 Tax=Nostoc punctiforme TaxID=272131 RepID=B2ITB9_NOSP7|nr:hypothetical protein [Nostoc punctiforme]ACC81150.1 hypothetical protein Npun_R2596 [Nostoc punctiforme PCC 73102]RCJ29201.1 hypothetical protein A6769_36000 [Nostoc punctiforme NIES-2108]
MTNVKREYPEFEVIYWNENGDPSKKITVRPAPFKSKKGGLSEVIHYQEKLLRDFVEHDGRLAHLLVNKSTWENMVKLAAILPVVGQPEPGFDIEAIANSSDLAQLGRIFFSENIKDNLEREKDANGNLVNDPSLIAKIHDINFSATLFRLVREREDESRKVRMAKLEQTLEQIQAEPVSEVPAISK